MFRAMSLLIAGTALATVPQGPAAAQAPAPAASAPPATDRPLVGGGDFISPAGEPFHSPDGLSGAEHWFQTADANHDGRLTLAEFKADALRFFRSLDVDHDGEIEPAEIDRYESDLAPEIRVGSTFGVATASGGDDSEPKEPPYPDRLGAGRYGYIDLPEPVVAMDSNFDRGISQAELVHAAGQRFAALDTNHDSAITREELPALRSVAGGGGRKHHHRQ